MKSFSIFIFLTILSIYNSRVIQITTNNIQLILKTTPHILLLLHNPQCNHSKTYAKQFLQVKSSYQMGIADCQKQKQLCNHFNITLFPTLVKLTNSSLSILDQQQFLQAQGLVSKSDPKVLLNQIVSKLKGENQYAVLILEEQGLQTLDKIQNAQEQNIYYLQSPSKLHSFFYNYVGKKIGCWIIKLKNQTLQKYYCGNGYRSQQVLKNHESYKKGRLLRYISTNEGDTSSLHYAQLSQMLKDLGRNYQKCRLIYFYSKQCVHCQRKDVDKINNIIKQLRFEKHIMIQIYDLDIQQIPQKLQLKRVPELLQFCQKQMTFYGQIFDQYNLRRFIGRARIVKQQIIPEIQQIQGSQQQIYDQNYKIKQNIQL